MPSSSFASQLHHFLLCRREARVFPRRHRSFFCLLLWCALVLHSGPAQTLPTALGSEQASRAQAKRFLGGRSAVSLPGVPTVHKRVSRGFAARSSNGGPRSAALANLSAPWSALGPGTVTTSLYGPVSGRITSVAIDPNDATGNTVWLGTTGGGVWKSTNAAGSASAVTFTPLTDTLAAFSANAGAYALPSLSIGAVAVQPSANPVVLAGTGDPNDATDSYYGEGILRSTDGGQTWSLAWESQDGVGGHHTFAGLASAGLAWSTATPTLAVAAMTVSTEGTLMGATAVGVVPGLYFTNDAGLTWQMAVVMDGGQIIQAPSSNGTAQVGASATSVVWDAQRGLFFAALQYHGYFSSPDGQNWTRLTHQPGTGITATNCPTGRNGQGSTTCPVLRGTLAVQPATGDLYALTVDGNDGDQGLWQDICNMGTNGQCASPTPTFSTRLDGGALDAGGGATGASTTIAQGSYNLSLLATPSSSGGTLLFAGTIDLYRCELAPGSSACTFRNTTNAGNGCNATSAVAPAQHALAAAQVGGSPMLFLGNDGGLWRSSDGVAQTGAVCASTDAAHFQNLNPAIGSGGSLAEVVGFAGDPTQAGTLIVGLGGNGSAATGNAGAGTSWTQLSEGEGGFPSIDPVSATNWYVAIGAGVNVKGCKSGAACSATDFSGSADIGAVQTMYDAALLDAPSLLDPQWNSQMLTATCRVWRGPASGGTTWNATDALSPSLDGGTTPCSLSSALVRSLGAGGPVGNSGATANLGSEVIYAGMAGAEDGGGSVPGHLFFLAGANTPSSATPWIDLTGNPVANETAAFNASGFDLSSVVVDSHDATGATVYATIMGFGSGAHVYRSTDFGAHWNDVSANLPDAPANSLAVDPNDANIVYVAMDTGVYATQAIATCVSQNCWSILGSALPNSPVTLLQAAANLPTGDGRIGMLRAGTYGRGLWQTPLLTAHSTAQPQLSASPASLSFLPQSVGTQSTPLTVTLLSYGNAPAQISSVQVTGDFVETDTCVGQALAPNANCSISVRFAPTATGNRSGLLTVYANVPSGQITVPLSGVGNAPAAIVLTPLQLTFASLLVNQTSAAQIITISNTGQTTATLQIPVLTGDFVLGANTCGTSLPSQTGCSFAVQFAPTASGTRTGSLSITDSAGTQTAQLTGVGQSPATDTLTPPSLVFGQQQIGTSSAAQQVTLTNAGDVPLTLINAVVTAGDFKAANSCGSSLAAHSSCAVNVSFVPTATGPGAGTLQVTDQFRTQTVALSGSGLAPPGISLSPSSFAFGSTGVGLNSAGTSILLSNNGGVALALNSITSSGDFAVASSTCGGSLAPGAACSLVIVFSPTAAGGRSGTLTVSDNAAGGSQTVTLSGTGVDFSLAADGPTSVNVSSGSVATYPLLLNSVAGLSGPVALTCAGVPANSVCTVNPATAQMGGSVLISVTVQTGISTTTQVQPVSNHSGRLGILLCFACMLTPFGVNRRKQIPRTFRSVLLALATVAVLTAGLAGCGSTRLIPVSGTGGTGGGGGGAGTGVAPTSPGTYAFTVTGSASGISHAVKLSISVN